MTRADRAGFVLLEAVVALLVLGLVGTAALSVAASALRVSGQTARLVEANALAVDRLDAMRLLTRDELDHLPDSIAAGRFAPPFDTYEWTATADEVRDEHHLIEVVVRVTWTGGARPLVTRLYRPPLRAGIQS